MRLVKMEDIKKKIAVLLSVIALSSFSVTTSAQERIKESISQDPQNIIYMTALTLMRDPVYKKFAPDYWNFQTQEWRTYPSIRLGLIDLNNDGIDEVIAYPVENVPEESGVLCRVERTCPNFIFTITPDRKVRLLSVIDATIIEVDDSSYNGYRRLKAHTANPRRSPDYYDIFQYDEESKQYKQLKY